MYLSANRYLSSWNDEDRKLINELNVRFDLPELVEDSFNTISAKEITFDVAYWRKANAIHAWFVKNVHEGKDECRRSYVEREQLQEPIDVCKQVLEDRSTASYLLPSQSGFFFGSTEYDDWYFKDLEYTVSRLTEVLECPTFKNCDFYVVALYAKGAAKVHRSHIKS